MLFQGADKTKKTKILSWNVNGIRAIKRKGKFDEVIDMGFDILCFQETKAERSQLDKELLSPKSYSSWFNSSQEKKGYSGVAVYSKEKPFRIVYGLPKEGNLTTKEIEGEEGGGVKETREEVYALNFDTQGRVITAYYINYVLINCYFPNGGRNQENLEYKLEFFDHFLQYVETLDKAGHVVIWTGDVNVAHKEIDLARPKENANSTGFLPVEREWLDKVTGEFGWVDIFRKFNPEATESYTYWDTITRARERNVGWRIDYFFISEKYIDMVKSIEHLTDVLGSDHCPVVLELEEPEY